MSFKKFLRIFSILAGKVYPSVKDPSHAFELLFNEKFFQNIVLENERIANELKGSAFKQKIGQSSAQSGFPKTGEPAKHTRVATEKIGLDKLYMDNLCFYLSNPKLIRFLESLHRTLYPLFQEYSIEGNLIDFAAFWEFFRDFEIFPDLITKVKLETLFDVLAYIHSRSPESAPETDLSRISSPHLINQHLFVESFIIIGLELKFKGEVENLLHSYASNVTPKKSIFHRIVFLLHLMNESKGLEKVNAKKGRGYRVDLVAVIRETFPEYVLQ